MDEDERQRRLEAYGFTTSARDVWPPPGDAEKLAPRAAEPAHRAAVPDTHPHPSAFARILDSWGFRYGSAVSAAAFVVGVMLGWGLVPGEALESAATSFYVFTLTPVAAPLWVAVGVLAPPAPFRTGLLLGLIGAASTALLLLMPVAWFPDAWFMGASPDYVLSLAAVMVPGAFITTGIVGWVVRRVFLPPDARRPFREQATLEPRARPWPPVVIALAYTSLSLVVLAPQQSEWIFAAAFASIITVAMIVGGLDIQRRYPERRTPVIVVGLVAGLIAGLAMIQAIWSESLWPGRRRSSDLLAIGVSTMLVIGATYVAYGEPLSGGSTWIVEPAAGAEAAGPDVELARGILEDRLLALDIEASLTAGDDGRISVRIPPDADDDLVSQVLGSRGLLEFTPVPSACAWEVLQDEPIPACLAEVEPLFDGTEIDTARIGQDPQTGEVVVSLELKETGAQLFDDYADQVYRLPNRNDRLFAIVLDGIVESAPSINAPRFGGQAQISGDFTVDEASALVASLQAGRSLPYAVSVTLAE